MKLTIAAVGRMTSGPEKTLVDEYLDRARAMGKTIGLAPVTLVEVDERKARTQASQSAGLIELLERRAREGGAVHAIALDERGRQISSPGVAELLAELRDHGTTETAFLIGGADGHDHALRERANRVLSLGHMVWPHMLARVMLAEQLWRAVSILGNSRYHRD